VADTKHKCTNSVTTIYYVINIIIQFTHIKDRSSAGCTARWKQQIVITFTVRQLISLKEILSSKRIVAMHTYEVLRMPHASKSHYHLYKTTQSKHANLWVWTLHCTALHCTAYQCVFDKMTNLILNSSAPFCLIPIHLMWTKSLLTDILNASWRNASLTHHDVTHDVTLTPTVTQTPRIRRNGIRWNGKTPSL